MQFIENRKKELIVLILLVFISGAIAKVPFLFNIDPELFYQYWIYYFPHINHLFIITI